MKVYKNAGYNQSAMPGINQLKQLNADLLTLGDEVRIRSTRGEKPVTVPIPSGIEILDDSEDFKNGMPQIQETEQEPSDDAERDQNDFSDIIGDDGAKDGADGEPEKETVPDMSDLLEPSADIGLDDLDLSEFETPVAPPEPEKEETPIEDLDLDALLAPSKKEPDDALPEAEPAAFEMPVKEDPLSVFAPETGTAGSDAQDAPSPVDFGDEPLDGMSADGLDSLPELGETDFSLDDNISEVEGRDLPGDLDSALKSGGGLDLPDDDALSAEEDEGSAPAEDLGLDGLDIDGIESAGPADMSTALPADGEPVSEADSPVSGESADSTDFSADDGSSLKTDTADELASLDLDSLDSGEMDGGLGSVDDFSAADAGPAEAPPADMEVPEEDGIETFDTSAMSGLDFSSDSSDPFGGSDFELGSITGTEGDDDDLFSIPGFSDTTTADLNKAPNVQTPDFSGAVEGDSKPKNTFTDAEYKRFKENLELYPLNVRIALEDLVVKNEFTDDAVFAVLEKVLRKVPARQLASELEKMLDIPLSVPRDFERRSATEYEAYKKSIEYQLKNRIIPGAILTTVATLVVMGIFMFSKYFIYYPLHAHNLYKQGYELLQESQYPQSEDKFNEALAYRSTKSWFYTYAEGYRSHRQYDRARMMYRAILSRFKHDKPAGLAWAAMEMSDLYNYEEAERVLKREVLDYHINDADAILLLGDLYLDWATERDPSKFEDAKIQYDLLVQLYGGTSSSNTYLSRQMRYYIRTDNLRQVLQYKEIFFPQKKALGAQDLTELSGYLLDKRFGSLRPSEESLRSSIENVRELLDRALKADSTNPVALYNMGRYFVETSNGKAAKGFLQQSIFRFENAAVRTRRDTYRYINAYRLLGEEYRDEREYILAEESYRNGIDIFEREHASSGFASDENVGRLYADVADLDYFISGDTEQALVNYINAVNNKHDTSSVRYRIGYIQYGKQNYAEALGSFIRSQDSSGGDPHLLLALANTLVQSSDNYVARGYYERLLNILNAERERYDIMLPQVRSDHADIVDTYMKGSNNLGVTLHRLAAMTGNSNLNSQAIVYLQESLRAWDALSRNQETMIRLDGSNLAEQNIKYITRPVSEYEPAIYTEIPRTLLGEEGLN